MCGTTRGEEKRTSDMPHRDYIVPPGLVDSVLRFGAHYKAAEGEPVLIEGPTGVGKTMFIDIFKILYRQEHGERPPIVTINCSHFDDQLARSELFGHMKGAFTDAKAEKRGLIETADGGLLILEEIGDLAPETQAKLLTFIEDKVYYRVGGVHPKKANVHILGATNRPRELRPDFRYRFFRFSIPPLYARRKDILYYLDAKFPGLPQRLSLKEVLAVLAHNWPGNVREIDTLGRTLHRDKYRDELRGRQLTSSNRPLSLEEITEGGFDFEYAGAIRKNIYRIDQLSQLLKRHEIEITEWTNLNEDMTLSKKNRKTKLRPFKIPLDTIIDNLLYPFFISITSDHIPVKEAISINNQSHGLHMQLENYKSSIYADGLGTLWNDVHNNESPMNIEINLSRTICEGSSGNTSHTSITLSQRFSSLYNTISDGLSLYCGCMLYNIRHNTPLCLRDAEWPYITSDPRIFEESTIEWLIVIENMMISEGSLFNVDDFTIYDKNGVVDISRIALSDFIMVPASPKKRKKRTFTPLMRLSRFKEKIMEAMSEVELSGDRGVLLKERREPSVSMEAENEKSHEPEIPLIPWKQLKKTYHELLLKKVKGNKAAAARIADEKYQSFNERVKTLKINANDFKGLSD